LQIGIDCESRVLVPEPGITQAGWRKDIFVIPWSLIDTAQVPGEDGELRLMQRGR